MLRTNLRNEDKRRRVGKIWRRPFRRRTLGNFLRFFRILKILGIFAIDGTLRTEPIFFGTYVAMTAALTETGHNTQMRAVGSTMNCAVDPANNTAMAKALAALKTAGIEDKDFQTSRLSLQPQYPPNRSGPSPIVGYRASNRVTVKLHDVGKVASVIDALVGAGANDIGNVNFTVSKASELLDQAREKALADAKRKAEIYAKAAGVTLGAPLSIAEEGAPTPVFRAKMMPATPLAMAAPTPIAQGEETLSVSVAVSWGIKAAQ